MGSNRTISNTDIGGGYSASVIGKIIKHILSFNPVYCFLSTFVMLMAAMAGMNVTTAKAADDVVYSTVGGTWEQLDETTWVMDKDGDGKTDITLVKDGNEWRYIFNVADDSATYYGWEAEVPEGYELENGYGSRENPAMGSNIKYFHSPNVDDAGIQHGNYAGGIDTTEVIKINGANSLKIDVKNVLLADANNEYFVIWDGSHSDYTAENDWNKGKRITFGTSYFMHGDTITIGFHSEPGTTGSYGYYGMVSAIREDSPIGLSATNILSGEDILKTGDINFTKYVKDENGNNIESDELFKFNVEIITEDEEVKSAISEEKKFGDVTFQNGKGSFYISANQTVKIKDVPTKLTELGGTFVTVKFTEVNNKDYTTTYAGRIYKDKDTDSSAYMYFYPETYDIKCVNYKKPSNPDTPETKTQPLIIQKKVQNGTAGDSFIFHALLEGLSANSSYSYKKGEDVKTFTSDESGTADVMFSLMDGEKAEFQELPEGSSYKITEDESNYYASFEITDAVNTVQQKGMNTEKNSSLSTAKEVIDENESATVTFTNAGDKAEPEEETAKVRIKKLWEDSENANGARPDSITVYLLQDENIIKNAELNDKNGWETEFDKLPICQEDGATKYKYSVKEAQVSGYVSNIEEETGEDEYIFTITNTKIETGTLKVSKTVEGNGADKNKEFKFHISLKKDGTPVTGVYKLDDNSGTKTGTIVFDENGEADLMLKHGESAVITGLPDETKYKVQEAEYKEYISSDDGTSEGAIAANTESSVHITNTYLDTHTLTVTKTVKGNQGNKTKQFNFTVTFTGDTIPESVTYMKGSDTGIIPVTNGQIQFTLAHNEQIDISGIPDGLEYTVSENGAEEDGYTVSSKGESGVINADQKASFVNTKNVGIPTGAMTNTFEILIVMAICGCIIVLCKRRKKEE